MQRFGFFGKVVAVLAALVMVLGLAGCGADSSSQPMVNAGDVPVPEKDSGFEQAVPEEGGDDVAGDADRMVIRTKTLRLEVESTAEALDKVIELTRTYKGTVSTMEVATNNDEWIYRYDETGDGTALRGWVTVRIPTDEYEAFVEMVSDVGAVKFQAEASSDVTQEYVDLSARLENLRAQEVRLREFFEAATDVEDMLAVEAELGRVRGDIESLDAQVKYLERQAAMATITVELTEPSAVVRPDGQSWGFVDAVTNGVRSATTLLTGLLTLVIAASPLWIAALVLFFPIRAWLRRRRAKKPSLTPPQHPQQSPPPPRPAPPTPQQSAPPAPPKSEGPTDGPKVKK